VIGLLKPQASLFAWYSIGLLARMALFFVIFGKLNGLRRLTIVKSVRNAVPSSNDEPGQPGRRPNCTKDADEILAKINRAKTKQAFLQTTSSPRRARTGCSRPSG
jgi:hypothetical protein